MIGTTHFINALVQANSLAPTAALRLGLPATRALPPLIDWPEVLVEATKARSYLAHGGYEFDGRPISPSDPDELRALPGVGDYTAAAIASFAYGAAEVSRTGLVCGGQHRLVTPPAAAARVSLVMLPLRL